MTNATGLTKGSIYGNFKDKNEVAVEAFKYNYKFQSELVLEKINQENKAIDKLLVYLNHYKAAFRPIFNNGGCAILNTAVDADDGNDLLKKEVIKTIHNWHRRIVAILTEGIKHNELEVIDVETFSYRMIALVEGSVMLAKTLDKPEILLNNIEFLETEIKLIKKS